MSAFTKGPWTVGRLPFNGDYAYLSAANGTWREFARVVVRLDEDDEDYVEGIANLHLLSSAPDMYDALENIMSYYETAVWEGTVNGIPREYADKANAALAKARGE